VLLSGAVIWLVGALARELTDATRPALLAARLCAYLPVTVLTALFPIKDVLLSAAAFYVLWQSVRLGKGGRVSVGAWALGVLSVLSVAFVRWPVVLLLVTFPVCFLLRRWLRERRWGCAALLVCCTLLVLLWSRDRILTSCPQS
jgi:branched-subunit amino acid transport protein